MKNLLLSLFLLTNVAVAQIIPDYAKEARWADFIEDGLMDGDVVWIQSGNREFLSILTESESESNKVAIVMHGIGVHPDWTGVIQPLRLSLIEQGYNTLSIQLPVLANDANSKDYLELFDDADNRIQTAVDYVRSIDNEADLIVAHSLGTTMASHYLSNNPKHLFKKFVAVGMNGGSAPYLSNINIPILDLYGTEDIDPVLNSIKQRQIASKNNSKYVQKQITGDHFFNDQNELLVQTVNDWLN